MANRATPKEWKHYVTARSVYSIINKSDISELQGDIIINARFNYRRKQLTFASNTLTRVDLNVLANRINTSVQNLPSDWLSLSADNFRILAKRMFIGRDSP